MSKPRLHQTTENVIDNSSLRSLLHILQRPEATSARRIRTNADLAAKSGIPIIALTAHALQGDSEQFLTPGMDDYVTKPVDLATLVAAIERNLGARTCDCDHDKLLLPSLVVH